MKQNVAFTASTIHNKATVAVLPDIKTAFDKFEGLRMTQ
jgi:hypothetical protein